MNKSIVEKFEKYLSIGRFGKYLHALVWGVLPLMLFVPTTNAQSLGEAVEQSALIFETSGDAPWFGQTVTTHDGIDAAQSGDVADSEASHLQATVEGPSLLGFWWKVSSESGYDFLRFYIDGIEQNDPITGEVDWEYRSVSIPPGSHTVKWSYIKDDILSNGSDCGWVDQLSVSGASTYTVTFDLGVHGTRIGGGNLTQIVTSGSSAIAPVVSASIGWFFDGWNKPLINITASTSITAEYTQGLSGLGIESDPYRIEDRADFDVFCFYTNYWADGVHTRLDSDIDLAGTIYTNSPIAPDIGDLPFQFQGPSFQGNFDGNSHVIHNLMITPDIEGSEHIGLFGRVSGSSAKIGNLGVENGNMTGNVSVGGLCGWNVDGLIDSCYVSGSVSGSNRVGVLCGYNTAGTITNCYATGSALGDDDASAIGGLCGWSDNGLISQCYAVVLVSAGGGCTYLGGFCGANTGGLISKSYSLGAVSSTDGSFFGLLGGFCGANDGSISDCYATGAVSNNNDVGGFCGFNSGSLSSSYSMGSVVSDFSGSGFCARNQGSVNSCFWDTQTSGQPTSNGGTGLSTADMQSLRTYLTAGWDFVGQTINGTEDIWDMSGYPVFSWSLSSAYAVSFNLGDHGVRTGGGSLNQSILPGGTAEPPTVSPNDGWFHTGWDRPLLITSDTTISAQYIDVMPGQGTQNNPYRIEDRADFEQFCDFPPLWAEGVHTRLDTDLDLSDRVYALAPIAHSAPGTPVQELIVFSGVFDGDGHVIRGLTIDNSTSANLGLFGNISGATAKVYGLGVEGCSINGGGAVGGICGGNDGGTISNSYVTGAISSAGDSVGGLGGYNGSGGRISRCYAVVSVTGHERVGGLCGSGEGSIIIDCYATGAVSGWNYVGGLCGWGGMISNCYATGSVSGGSRSGGLIGTSVGSVVSSFWDTQTSGKSTSYGGTGLSTAEMQTPSTFTEAGWDFVGEEGTGANDIWTMAGYPVLSWSLGSAYSVVFDLDEKGTRSGGGDLNQQVPAGGSALAPTVSALDGWIFVGWDKPLSMIASNTVLSAQYWDEFYGAGTQNDPFLIEDRIDFDQFCVDSNYWAEGIHIRLEADLDLSGTNYKRAPIAPINSSGGGTPFSGVFDGNGHVIHNLSIDAGSGPYQSFLGLFGKIRGRSAQIRGLGLEGVHIAAPEDAHYIGGLCGDLELGTILDCFTTGNVSAPEGTSYIGGLCGYLQSGSIHDCFATGAVSGGLYCHSMGGLCGVNKGGTISGCYATGSVSGHSDVGGLCGWMDDSGIINDCYATGETVGLYAGGLCGGNYRGTISGCYATGSVSGDSGVGGLCGSNDSLIRESYATGSVSGGSGGGTGGFCAYNSGDIGGCYSAGAISAAIDSEDIGGFCGNNWGTINNDCFWDMQSSNQTNSYGGVGKTTVEMQTETTFIDAGWDLTGETANGTNDTWIMSGYPELAWTLHANDKDSDGDKLPDNWEVRYFGNTETSDGTGDFDHDGISDRDEYICGTLPNSSESVFKATISKSMSGYMVEWEAVEGRVYSVLWSASLTQSFQPLASGLNYPQNSYADTEHPTETTGYYRVTVSMLDGGDLDGDGMPDSWESQYGVTLATVDTDADGFDNLAEYIAGTNPTNKASRFEAQFDTQVVNGTNAFVVSWSAVTGRVYDVRWAPCLTNDYQTLYTGLEYPQNSYTDLFHAAESQGFYQVDVRLKP